MTTAAALFRTTAVRISTVLTTIAAAAPGETAGSKETSDNENRLDGDEDSEEDDARPPDEIAFRLICSDCECQCINFDNRDNSAFPEFDCDDGECFTTLVTAESVFDCRF